MSKEIHLTKGQVAIIDDEDFDRVSRLKWSLHGAGYAVGHDPQLYVPGKAHKALVLLHRYILGCKPGDRVKVDHRNHNKLDNRRENLRTGSQSNNMFNRARTIREGFTSKYRGVAHNGGKSGKTVNDRGYSYRSSKPWLCYYGKKYLGIFAEQEEAAYCRDLAALKEEGLAAQLNFPIKAIEVNHV